MWQNGQFTYCHNHDDTWENRQSFTSPWSWWCYLTWKTSHHTVMIISDNTNRPSHYIIMLPDKPSHSFTVMIISDDTNRPSHDRDYHDAFWQAITLSWSYLIIQTGLHMTMIIMMLPDKPSRCHDHIWQERQAFTSPWLSCFLIRKTSSHITMIINNKASKPWYSQDHDDTTWRERQASTSPWSYLIRHKSLHITVTMMLLPHKPSHCQEYIWDDRQDLFKLLP